MTRAQLEHIIRAACAICGDDELYIAGSQSILGKHPDAPSELLVSMEADAAPRHYPEREELIEGAIGELSPFHRTFGYYADGIEMDKLSLPQGWTDRVVIIRNRNTNRMSGLCLEPHDCAISKLFAGRDKDMVFIATLLRLRLLRADRLRELLPLVRFGGEKAALSQERLERILREQGL